MNRPPHQGEAPSQRYAHGDACPNCRHSRLLYEPIGDGCTDPDAKPSVYCPDCGVDYLLDEPRVHRRLLAERIARELFTNGQGKLAKRLALELPGKVDIGGWSEAAAVSQIAKLLEADAADPQRAWP